MKKQWLSIEVSCGTDIADELAAAVADAFHTGVEITGAGIRFYLEGDYLVEEEERELQRVLDEVGKSYHLDFPLTFTVSPLFEEDWADRWKVHFKPLPVGAHFLVCPTWEEPKPAAGDRVIWMDPGRAFGTGHHESTRLCLEWLEDWASSRNDLNSCSFLDVGTGSGILAIAAALLGFSCVLGIDNDPEAIEVAAENVSLNGMAEKIRLKECTVADIGDRFDVVIANIQALPLIEMAGHLADRVKPGGRLALSGVLVEQGEAVVAAFEGEGRRPVNTLVSGEWCLLEFE